MIMTGLAKAAVPVMGAVLVAAGIAAVILWGGKLFANTTTHQDQAVAADSASDPRAAIPPIDAAAPAETETATFALG
jgi:hypothetical protein